jgi:hypothetical protein
MMAALFAFVERKPVLSSIIAAAGVALALKLIFQIWLGVPLPRGPWGL